MSVEHSTRSDSIYRDHSYREYVEYMLLRLQGEKSTTLPDSRVAIECVEVSVCQMDKSNEIKESMS